MRPVELGRMFRDPIIKPFDLNPSLHLCSPLGIRPRVYLQIVQRANVHADNLDNRETSERDQRPILSDSPFSDRRNPFLLTKSHLARSGF